MTKRESSAFLFWFILIIFLLWNSIMVSFEKDNPHYSLKVIQVNSRWRYEILRNNQPFIVQQYMPVIEGNIPFKNKLEAKKTGSLVLEKLQKNLSPSISIQELSNLGIVKKDTFLESD